MLSFYDMKLAMVFCVIITCRKTLGFQSLRRFPDDFIFGAATASYQIEGGWNSDEKGENIWDHLTHQNPGFIIDQSNGDVACDSYHNYKRDVEMMRELGINAYRFSISWSRILPYGFHHYVSESGIAFYNNYINEMIKYNITPIATLYHWDLPQKLQDLGGFANPYFADWFEDYSRVVFKNFGDRVKKWITFNEPREICYEGYGSNTKAPALNIKDVGTYICAKNLVIAHAKAYHLYDRDYKPQQNGECGITISVHWYGPLTNSTEDHFAAEIKRQFEWGIYAEPIFSKDGGFPKEFEELVAAKSLQQGYKWSRMPAFSEKEKSFVKGTFDFFGVNHYTAKLVSAKKDVAVHNSDDAGFRIVVPKEWPRSASAWLVQAPNSIYKALVHLKNKYNNPIFYITENGWSSPAHGGLIDEDRVKYYRDALESVLDAIDAGVRVKGYMAWSLMDNFEWKMGYTEQFGLYHVQFDDPKRTRTPRKSAFVYKQIISSRTIDPNYDTSAMIMKIDENQ